MTYIAKYTPAHISGYHYEIGERGRNLLDPSALKDKHGFRDVTMTRPGYRTDIECLDKNALITINGFVHDTGMFDGRFYVLNAVPALLKSSSNHIGIIDLYGAGVDLDKRPITAEMISSEENQDLYRKAIITFDEPVDGCILVLSGYLIEENDETFRRVSDRSFILTLEKLDFITRFYELDSQYDIFEDMGIERSPVNDKLVSTSELLSDETILKFLTRQNTFLVNLKDRYVNFHTKSLAPSPNPVLYRTNHSPEFPIVGGAGKLIEYRGIKTSEFVAPDGKVSTYSIMTTDAVYNNLVSNYAPSGSATLTNNHRLMGDRYKASRLNFLMIEVGEY